MPAEALAEGISFFNEGRHAQALGRFQAAVDAGTPGPEARYFLAHTLAALGEDKRAAAAFTGVARLFPRYLPGRLGLAAALRKTGNLDGCLDAAASALKLSPGNAQALALRREVLSAQGLAQHRAGRFAKAADCLARARAAGAADLDTKYFHALSLWKTGAHERALDELKRVAREFPDFIPARRDAGLLRVELSLRRARALHRAGRAAAATAELRRALKAGAGIPAARGFLDGGLKTLGRSPEAFPLFLDILSRGVFPKEEVEDSLAALANSFWAAGRQKEARGALVLLEGLAPTRAALRTRVETVGAGLRFASLRLSSRQKGAILKDGYAVVAGCAPEAVTSAARAAVDRAFARKPSKRAGSRLGEFGEYRSEFLADPEILALLYRTPAWALAETLIGRGKVAPCELAQVVLRYPAKPSEDRRIGLHIDGVYDKGTALNLKTSSFTATLCFLLNDWTEEYCGNFAVSPGSHLVIARSARRGGPAALKRNFAKLALPPPVQILGKTGDLVLAHYQLAHDGHRNFSPRTRYAVFFRLRHVDHDKRWARALADPWLEWGGLRR